MPKDTHIMSHEETGTFLTLDDLPRLKKAYEEAVANNENTFMFEVEAEKVGVLTDWAKYAIEYLEMVKKQTV